MLSLNLLRALMFALFSEVNLGMVLYAYCWRVVITPLLLWTILLSCPMELDHIPKF